MITHPGPPASSVWIGDTVTQLETSRTGLRSGLSWIPVAGDLTVANPNSSPALTGTLDDDLPLGGPHGNPQMASSILILYADGHVRMTAITNF